MPMSPGVRTALDRLSELLAEQVDLDTTAYDLRREAEALTRRDPAYVERILQRLDRIDIERETGRQEIRRILREKIEPALDKASAKTERRISELETALVQCLARYQELEQRIKTLEERPQGRSHIPLERIK